MSKTTHLVGPSGTGRLALCKTILGGADTLTQFSEKVDCTECLRLMIQSPAAGTQVDGNHYLNLKVQPWEAMESWLSREQFHGYLRGNVIKYLARAGSKGEARTDLRKARHYLDRLLELESEEGPNL